MLDLSAAVVTMEFDFGRVRNAVMRVDVSVDERVYSVPCEFSGDTGQGSISIPIRLPTVLTITASGKGPMDTLVDDQGNIIQDCYARLQAFYLDGFRLDDYFLYHKVHQKSVDGQELTSNYFGFNGQAVIHLDRNSVFAQYCFLNQSN